MEAYFSIAVVIVSIVLFLWLAPVDTLRLKVRRFSFLSLAFLVALCAVVFALCVSRVHSLDLAFLAFELFLLLFAPMYVAGAGFLRSRLLSKVHAGGRSTL